MSYFHPKDTSELLEEYMKSNQCDHLAYGMYYAALIQKKENNKGRDAKKLFNTNIKKWNVHERNKKNILKVTNLLNDVLFVTQKQNEISVLRAFSEGKLLIGTGAIHVLESTLTIHQIYGVPYIPASSMKGLVRNWVVQAFFNGEDPFDQKTDKTLDEKQKIVKAIMIDIFGDKEHRGKAQFYDVFPSTDYDIVPDVLTVHFPNYYQRKSEATDNQTVIPFTGLQVIEASYYDIRFTLRKYRKERMQSSFSSEELMKILKDWVTKMLLESGVGAKTSTGYGQFYKVEEVTSEFLEQFEQKQRKMEEIRRQEEEAKRLALLKPDERLVEIILQLDESVTSQDQSKGEVYKQALELAEQGYFQPAEALYEYWKKTGNLKVKKGTKQAEKIQRLKELIKQ
ncbi:type III-B CRISPR module RAMP protein Cmr6 [Ureibacillus thermosphaericus]|uniref:CRISPR-associated protein Cmr6 n=1 Tax=Ureibacillus thermosphaericus TaxID=51173 RepID=A0A840PV10_URETH|nr:type III-B CRISPR module RAMP protein Cmr6 [Ureibacillus thermosphaericus]MBB5149084.1 CRISPR-associated protein Cmr6 [Ureibacillus thermosphaericus]NKZ31848.1 type III-B CRISPR module RAMP protein Cmr6 [Ureibacillus thermosphaericus]